MVAFNYSFLDIKTWHEGGPNQCTCFLLELYMNNFSLENIINDSSLPKSDANGVGNKFFYVA